MYADYSGAMVLQIPLDVACHVALQMQPVAEHRLWKHMQGGTRPSSGPVIRIVSMTANKHNRCVQESISSNDMQRIVGSAVMLTSFVFSLSRAPSFNIQLSELMNGSVPKPYNDVKSMLEADVARQWAAYVVGCAHVLMHEKDVRFADSIAILVDSDVPEGVHLVLTPLAAKLTIVSYCWHSEFVRQCLVLGHHLCYAV